VEMREYVSEAEVLKDFAKENATHGSPMDDFTRRKLTTAMAEAGVSVNEIASIFNVSVRRVESYGDGIVRVELKSGGIEDKPVKRGFETENIISEAQYVEHEKKDRGFPLASQVGQLLRWLNNGHIPYTESNKATLKELREAIDQYFKLEKKKRVLEKV
jgi:transposase